MYLKSSSGKIPAGNVNVDLNTLKKGNNKMEMSILKCPDKAAVMLITLGVDV